MCLFFFAAWIVLRTNPILVGIALRDTAANPGLIWGRTASNSLRLLAGTLVTFAPYALVLVARGLWFEDELLSREGYALARAFDAITGEIVALIPLTFLSLSYRHFMYAE